MEQYNTDKLSRVLPWHTRACRSLVFCPECRPDQSPVRILFHYRNIPDDTVLKQEMETFRFDYEFKFDYECAILAFELVNLTTRSSAVLAVNKRTATGIDAGTILRIPVTNVVVPKSRTRSRSRTCCQ